MIIVPVVSGLLGVWQRQLSALIGEGVIYDLRVALYSHLQHMSLRFFTNTKTGELMSRLNNDVGGAQQAVSGTIVDLLTNVITLVSTMAIMLRLEWRLTILAVIVLPFFLLPVRLLGKKVRDVVRSQMVLNSEMNSMMEETLNVSGALLVKLFGRVPGEIGRFSNRAANVREAGIRQATLMRWFFLIVSLVSAVGTAIVFWVGGMLVLHGTGFTIGTIVAFTAYLGMLYGPLSALSNTRVNFDSSVVSFERFSRCWTFPSRWRSGLMLFLCPTCKALCASKTSHSAIGRARRSNGNGCRSGGCDAVGWLGYHSLGTTAFTTRRSRQGRRLPLATGPDLHPRPGSVHRPTLARLTVFKATVSRKAQMATHWHSVPNHPAKDGWHLKVYRLK